MEQRVQERKDAAIRVATAINAMNEEGQRKVATAEQLESGDFTPVENASPIDPHSPIGTKRTAFLLLKAIKISMHDGTFHYHAGYIIEPDLMLDFKAAGAVMREITIFGSGAKS